MFDHMAIAVSDMAASARFYRTVLAAGFGAAPRFESDRFVIWGDLVLTLADSAHCLLYGEAMPVY